MNKVKGLSESGGSVLGTTGLWYQSTVKALKSDPRGIGSRSERKKIRIMRGARNSLFKIPQNLY